MMEPVVQDYLDASLKLEADDFCSQVGPVLVSLAPALGPTFQTASTEMFQGKTSRRRNQLDHRLPVMELGRNSRHGFDELRLGRSEDNHLVVSDETVSARHARLFQVRTSGAIFIEDLDSTNGSTLNGKPLLPGRAVELADGDLLGFGDTFFLFYTPRGFHRALRRLAGQAAP